LIKNLKLNERISQKKEKFFAEPDFGFRLLGHLGFDNSQSSAWLFFFFLDFLSFFILGHFFELGSNLCQQPKGFVDLHCFDCFSFFKTGKAGEHFKSSSFDWRAF
jgi:hypothetical protein